MKKVITLLDKLQENADYYSPSIILYVDTEEWEIYSDGDIILSGKGLSESEILTKLKPFVEQELNFEYIQIEAGYEIKVTNKSINFEDKFSMSHDEFDKIAKAVNKIRA